MKLTVLVATYKRPQFLEKCLHSLAEQERLPDEVVVIVRDTDEDTQTLLRQWSNPLESKTLFKIAEVRTPGIVNAENAGLAQATGDIVALIDDDAVALPDWMRRIEEHYQNSEVGAVGGPAIPFVEGRPILEQTTNLCLRKTWYGAHIGNSEKIPDSVREVHALRGCNMSFRRALIRQFDTRLKPYWRRFEDDATLSIYRRHYKIIYDPQVKVYHYTAPIKEGKTRDQDRDSIFGSHHNNTYVMLKHSGPWQQFIFLGFTFLVGDRTNLGIGGYLARGLWHQRLRANLRELSWALEGKLSGIQSYRQWWHEEHSP